MQRVISPHHDLYTDLKGDEDDEGEGKNKAVGGRSRGGFIFVYAIKKIYRNALTPVRVNHALTPNA